MRRAHDPVETAVARQKRQAQRLVGEGAEKMWVGTFHSTAVKILRREAARIGIVPSFVIFDEDDTRAALENSVANILGVWASLAQYEAVATGVAGSP